MKPDTYKSILKVKKYLFVVVFTLGSSYANAQLSLSADFTNSANKKGVLFDIWDVINRISPVNGASVSDGMSVNTIRMVGGIKKKVNGKTIENLEYDPVTYDANSNTYVYNWQPLKSRINAIQKDGVKIYQMVIDQVPWAFQHGYTFIPKGKCDSIHFREDERITNYGNSLPPFDKVAYADFIKAMVTELVSTYGKKEVLSWRFRVGSEIETPDHWKGTEQDFIEHYANTVKAVLSVLPEATIGLHTREPGFVYKKGTVLNYKGQPIQSFAKGLIEYCYDNNIKYDFWGVSEYILINSKERRDVATKYEELFAPLTNNPKWNKKAVCDIMEYSVIIGMGAPDGGSYLNSVTSHTEVANLVFSNVFYKNEDKGLEKIFRWGQRPGDIEDPSIETLKTMTGKVRFQTEISGKPINANNQLDAIFSVDDKGKKFDVLVYNFNSNSLDYVKDEPITISFITDLAVGEKIKYRSLSYGKAQNKFQNFMENEPKSGWVLADFDRKGSPSRILNEAGKAAWKSYENPNPYKFSSWNTVITTARTDGGKGSIITINTEIPSFAFQKFEVQ